MFNQSISTQGVEYQVLSLQDFRHGLNTYVAADRIAPTEASKLVNWTIVKGGGLISRQPVIQYSTTGTTSYAAVKHIREVKIGGTAYVLLVDSNYRLYYLNGTLQATYIATLEGDATILSYNNAAVVCDGSYLKYLSSISAVKICYDGGTGSSGVQFTNLSLDQDTFLPLGDGTITKVAQKFTSQAFTTGYTIPITQCEVYLDKNGAPTGTVTAVLRKVSGGSVIASKVLCDASEATAGTPAKFTALFTSSDITEEMSPSTVYYISMEYTGGDAANYVKVMCNNIGSGGLSYYYDGSWKTDTAKNCIMSVSPGRPPKGKFGAIWNKRLFIAGDPDNLGVVWYGNLTQLDWSTTDGGGYLSVVDDHADSFQVGAMTELYGNLYVFGTQAQPYLVKISGATPNEYAQETMFQRPWATHKTLVNAVNDIWYSTGEGTAPISGVQEYGDLRSFFSSDAIQDRYENYWSTNTAIAGYHSDTGQLLLVLDYHRILACHTKLASQGPDGGAIRYPWAEYEIYRYNFSSSSYCWIKSQSGTNEYFLSAPQYEDWTGHTEVDLNDHITVAANSITAALSLGEDAYLYYDLGGDIISGDFEYRVQAKFNSGEGIVVFAGVSDTVADLFSLQTAGGHEICVRGAGNGGEYVIYLSESYGVYEGVDWVYADVDTDYYLKVVRDESVGTYGTVYCYIYSDSNYSVLVDTLSLALSGKYDYRYIMSAQSYCIGTAETLSITISNLIVYDKPYDPSITAQPGYITMDGIVLTEGTVGSLSDHGWDYDDNDTLGFNTVYIRDETGDPDVTGVEIRAILKPTSFGTSGDYFLIGGSDGYVYRFDKTDYKDMTNIQIKPILRTAYIEMPFSYVNFNQIQLFASSKGGGYIGVNLYTNGRYGATAATVAFPITVKDDLTVSEYTMDVSDMLFTVSPSVIEPLFKYINFNCRSVMIELTDAVMSGYAMNNNGIILKYRRLSY